MKGCIYCLHKMNKQGLPNLIVNVKSRGDNSIEQRLQPENQLKGCVKYCNS